MRIPASFLLPNNNPDENISLLKSKHICSDFHFAIVMYVHILINAKKKKTKKMRSELDELKKIKKVN